jgi:LPXTG-motif cell wall-anchored protein
MPNTGAGDVIGIFIGAVVTGTIGFRMFVSRKLARR